MSNLHLPSLSQKWTREAAKYELLLRVVLGQAPGLLRGEVRAGSRTERGSKKVGCS